jgi:methionine-rich copper-binding protein CopC
MFFNHSRALVWARYIAVSFAVGLSATAALAHAHLEKQTPAAGSKGSAPTEIRLKFSEGLELKFSTIALTSSSGASQATGNSTLDPADNSVLIAAVPGGLKPGVYTVSWRAVSVDTHKTQGSYNFTVAP